MSKALQKTTLWGRAIHFMVFVVVLVLPFIIQKAHLDVTRGGWRPERANFSSHLLLPSLVLPLVVLAFLPFSPKAKLVMSILLAPIFIFALGVFRVAYSCDNYGHSCF